jgi:short-subunit dehydrogenase
MQRVFITGASTGLGEGLAHHYAKPGAVLGLVARRRELLLEHQRALSAKGAVVHVYAADVADTAALKDAADDFVAKAGGIDLVIANAGIGIKDGALQGDANEIARLMGVNVVGVTNSIVPFVPKMIEQKSGVLCAVSSIAGYRALPGRGAYSASKSAVIVYMDALRMELVDAGVHAMTLCPGFVDTPLTKGNKGMVFVMTVDEAVRLMVRAIEKRKRTYAFPWQMNLIRHAFQMAPEWLLRKVAPPPRSSSS